MTRHDVWIVDPERPDMHLITFTPPPAPGSGTLFMPQCFEPRPVTLASFLRGHSDFVADLLAAMVQPVDERAACRPVPLPRIVRTPCPRHQRCRDRWHELRQRAARTGAVPSGAAW